MAHWSIKNAMHRHLDVNFGEDASRKRKDNAVMHSSTHTKMVLTLLRRGKSTKVGIRSKRLKAGLEDGHPVKIRQRRMHLQGMRCATGPPANFARSGLCRHGIIKAQDLGPLAA